MHFTMEQWRPCKLLHNSCELCRCEANVCKSTQSEISKWARACCFNRIVQTQWHLYNFLWAVIQIFLWCPVRDIFKETSLKCDWKNIYEKTNSQIHLKTMIGSRCFQFILEVNRLKVNQNKQKNKLYLPNNIKIIKKSRKMLPYQSSFFLKSMQIIFLQYLDEDYKTLYH